MILRNKAFVEAEIYGHRQIIESNEVEVARVDIAIKKTVVLRSTIPEDEWRRGACG